MMFRKTIHEIVKLGRWDHRITEKNKDIKVLWANVDNCGDKICGSSEYMKKMSNIYDDSGIQYVVSMDTKEKQN